MSRLIVRKMDDHERVDSFNCGERYSDLNDFIINDAPLYRKELFAVTYLMEDEGAPVAYFSLANDRIGIEDFHDTTSYNRFRRKRFVNSKRIKHYPAVKICRLGVDISRQFAGVGTKLMNFIKLFFLDDNKTGCRYITVDAHIDAVPFYMKNGFELLQDIQIGESSDSTVLMFYDLMALRGQDK